jgi:hypothetical protein
MNTEHTSFKMGPSTVETSFLRSYLTSGSGSFTHTSGSKLPLFGSRILVQQMRVLGLSTFPKILNLHDRGKKRCIDSRLGSLGEIVAL